MRASVASESAVRPTASSQRGDSGIDLRIAQTTIAAAPAITNIQRQPMVGITK